MRLLIVLLIGSALWGQAPKESPQPADKTEKVDKAEAYYRFMLAHMYATDRKENLEAAKKADPQVPTDVGPLIPMLPFIRVAPVVRPATPSPQR